MDGIGHTAVTYCHFVVGGIPATAVTHLNRTGTVIRKIGRVVIGVTDTGIAYNYLAGSTALLIDKVIIRIAVVCYSNPERLLNRAAGAGGSIPACIAAVADADINLRCAAGGCDGKGVVVRSSC